MAGATGPRQKKQASQPKQTRPAKKTRSARAGQPSGAVIVLSGATPLRRQKAAEVLAEELQLHLASVDLSAVVSAHARETEKNVTRVFDMANRHGSILFFDEADALFGKRSRVQDARDRFAQADVSYLLQSIEKHQGLVIVATNGKSRIEDAFSPEKPVIVLGGTAKRSSSKKKPTTPAATSKKKAPRTR
ncbi:MAG: AAA family ATPase [Nitrospira sp.]|nr:AAA family ATPase [Nitrospira sp.]